MNTIGSRIRQFRKEKVLSQKELGALVNKSGQVISNWERGYTQNITHEDIVVLSKALGKPTSVLLGDFVPDQPSPTPDLPEIPEGLPFKPTSRDKKQWKELLEKNGQAFFYNDEIDEEDKKEMLDLLTEFFIDAKVKNKVKYGRKKKKESEVVDNGGNA